MRCLPRLGPPADDAESPESRPTVLPPVGNVIALGLDTLRAGVPPAGCGDARLGLSSSRADTTLPTKLVALDRDLGSGVS